MGKREIKFRIWAETDDAEAEMIYLDKGEFDNGLWFEAPKHLDKHHETMQFTGMKDKNGKEIWEGDLVKRNGHIRKVVFNEGAFCLWGIKQFEGTLDPMTVMLHGSALYNFLSDIEVIGNVFENTELSVGKI